MFVGLVLGQLGLYRISGTDIWTEVDFVISVGLVLGQWWAVSYQKDR